MNTIGNVENASLAAYFQAKLNENAVLKFGFKTMTEYFNFFADLYDVPESSIRRRRDEFDYFFDNDRNGYNRRPNKNVQILYDSFKKLSDDLILKKLNNDIDNNRKVNVTVLGYSDRVATLEEFIEELNQIKRNVFTFDFNWTTNLYDANGINELTTNDVILLRYNNKVYAKATINEIIPCTEDYLIGDTKAKITIHFNELEIFSKPISFNILLKQTTLDVKKKGRSVRKLGQYKFKTLERIIDNSNDYQSVEENEKNLLVINQTDVECDYSYIDKKEDMELGLKKNHNFETEISVSGTINNAKLKLVSGARAENYFISFLNSIGFSNEEVKNCANDKRKPYDVDIIIGSKNIGLEIKNIGNGGFYLSDNEIIQLLKNKTHLILVDIDKNIWLLKNENKFLENTIENIKKLYEESNSRFDNLEVTEIRIVINKNLRSETISLIDKTKDEFINLIFDSKN